MKTDRRHALNAFLDGKRVPGSLQIQAREAMEPLFVALDKGSFELADREEVDEQQITRILRETTGNPVSSVVLLSMRGARRSYQDRKNETRGHFDSIAAMRRVLNEEYRDRTEGNLPARISARANASDPQELRSSVGGFLHSVGLSNGFVNALRSKFGGELGEEMCSVMRACASGYLVNICREQVTAADDFGSALDLVMTSYPMFQMIVPQDAWQILVA